MGRPRKEYGKRDSVIKVRLNENELRNLNTICRYYDTNISDYIRKKMFENVEADYLDDDYYPTV